VTFTAFYQDIPALSILVAVTFLPQLLVVVTFLPANLVAVTFLPAVRVWSLM
jgi:hypothetical protein